jgi:hypothetical protein
LRRILFQIDKLQFELSFLIVSLSFSISRLRAWASASAVKRAARSERSIACSVTTSSGRESSMLIASNGITT